MYTYNVMYLPTTYVAQSYIQEIERTKNCAKVKNTYTRYVGRYSYFIILLKASRMCIGCVGCVGCVMCNV